MEQELKFLTASRPSSVGGVRRVPLVLLGVGGVGRALLRHILENRDFHLHRFNLTLDLVCIAGSEGYLAGQGDLPVSDEVIRSLIEGKLKGRAFLEQPGAVPHPGGMQLVAQFIGPGSILVDATASSDTAPALLDSLARAGRVVLANKKPLAGDLSLFQALTGDPTACRWETTVGSCLPIMVALSRIMASGDEVQRIAGTFSGTLGFLMTRLQEGVPFSRLIRQAYEAGFTEPDPREDLAGTDVARKSLILARVIGWQLNLADVEVRGLLPGELDNLPVNEFLARTGDLDEYFSVRVRSAQKHGRVLRYAAVIENGKCRVGPEEVALETPLGRLRGNDNLIEIYTRLYDPHPLVIQGRGAGVPATAAGVLSDIIDLAVR